ncbi:hypothetical protein ACLK2H_12345 [Escherichia coli]
MANRSADAIPMLIDQGDNDQFLADQLQPAVFAEAARQKEWPLRCAFSQAMTIAITLLRRLLRSSALPPQYLLK